MTNSATGVEETVNAYVEVWNQEDYAKIPELVTGSFVLYDPAIPAEVAPGPEGEAHGSEGLESFLKWLRTGFPDFQIDIINLVSNEALAMDEVKFTGTNTGNLSGLPPTGRQVELMLMSIFIIEKGKIREQRVYLDQQEFAEQLGLSFPGLLTQVPKLAIRKLRMSV